MGCDIHIVTQVRRDGRWVTEPASVPDDRDYRSFAVMAGVRNYGTNPPIVPISEPRGLPPDFVEEEGDDTGDHSKSWLTLAELLSVDMSRTITMTGIVSQEAASAWKNRGVRPSSWCQGTSDVTAVRIEWPQTLAETLHLLPFLIEALKPLGEPEDVRIVFGFDN